MSSVHIEKTIWVRALFRVGRQLPAREEWRWITHEEDDRHRSEAQAKETAKQRERELRENCAAAFERGGIFPCSRCGLPTIQGGRLSVTLDTTTGGLICATCRWGDDE